MYHILYDCICTWYMYVRGRVCVLYGCNVCVLETRDIQLSYIFHFLNSFWPFFSLWQETKDTLVFYTLPVELFLFLQLALWIFTHQKHFCDIVWFENRSRKPIFLFFDVRQTLWYVQRDASLKIERLRRKINRKTEKKKKSFVTNNESSTFCDCFVQKVYKKTTTQNIHVTHPSLVAK